MIAARQIAFGRGAKKGLPSGVIPVEYLESTGTQYIDTGIIAASNDSFDVNFAFSVKDSSLTCIGAANDSTRLATVWVTVGGAIRFGGGEPMGTLQSMTWLVGEFNRVSVSYSNCSVNGRIIQNTSIAGFDDSKSTGNIWIFQCNGRTSTSTKIKVSSFAWYRNGILVLDLIPVRVGNVGYMYDKVSSTLFGNSGTGEFVLGPDVAGSDIDYTAKDYVQDGLVAMWDGIENAGWGVHDDTATVWKDLTENGRDLTLTSHGSWSPLGLVCDGVGYAAKGKNLDIPSKDILTVEVVYSSNMADVGIVAILGLSPQLNRGVILVQRDGKLCGMSVQSASAGLKNSINCVDGVKSAAFVYSESDMAYAMLNGLEVATGYTFTSYVAYKYAVGGRAENTDSPLPCENMAIRVHNRTLTAEEIAHNYEIDKARFGI